MDGRTRLATLAAAIGCLVAPAAADAATRYAEPGGNGPEPCLQSDPCDIQVAVEGTLTSSVVNGDEVILLAGTYTIGSTSADRLLIGDSIDVHGDLGQAPPTLATAASTPAVSQQAVGGRLRHLRIEHTGTGTALDVSGGVVEEVFVHATAANQSACSLRGATIRDSVCWSDATNGVGVGRNESGSTFTGTLRNVTAIGTGATSYGIRIFSSTGGQHTYDAKSVVADGTEFDVLANADASSSATVTLDHSNYATESEFSNGGSATITDPGSGTNQTLAPIFVSAATGDFHQVAGSPTIDAGALDGFSGSVDFDGQPRVDGMAVDIGADEFPDADDDNDGDNDGSDNCQFVANPDQANNDADAQGDVCDSDDDNDTVADTSDNCQVVANPDQANNDADAQGDVCDSDDDNDTVADGSDNCVTDANASQANNDADAQGDVCDSDDDNDSVADAGDSCPAQAGPASNGGCPEAARDTDAPETTIVKQPRKRTFSRSAKFELGSDDPAARFECSLDGGAFSPCEASVKLRVRRGNHTFAARAVDAAGNADDTPAEAKWKVKRRR